MDSKVTLFITLSAEYTNEDTEPVLETQRIPVPTDHPVVHALLAIWHIDDETGKVWADNPMDDPAVRKFVDRLNVVLVEALH